MVLLEDSLLDAVEGKGSGWLIGGESGVGKSRLASEIRIRALIAGSIEAQQAIMMSNEIGGLFAAGIAHRIWAQALNARGEELLSEIEHHFRTSLDLFLSCNAHFEMERTRYAWDNLAII